MLRAAGREVARWQEVRELQPTLARVRPYSMVPEFALIDLARRVRTVLADDVPGNFVECGTWRGGASFLMADLLRQAGIRDRKVWLCDSFEGHRPPEAIDGTAALAYARNTDDPEYLNNCRADLTDVQHSAELLGLNGYTELVKGWFDKTLPAVRDRIGAIGLLRIDCDC